MNDAEAEILKVVRNSLMTGEGRLFDHVNATFRWLMATLFAANGGAIIGLLGWNDVSRHGGYSALGWFAGGLVLSILMGTFSAVGALVAIKPIETARLAIDQALITRVLPEKEVFDGLVARNRPSWKTWVASYTGSLL